MLKVYPQSMRRLIKVMAVPIPYHRKAVATSLANISLALALAIQTRTNIFHIHSQSRKHLQTRKTYSRSVVILNALRSGSQSDMHQIRSVKLWSFKRNTFLPAVSLEGVTSTDYIRRDIAEAADLEIEELGGGHTSLSGQDDFFPHEGCVVIAWQSEGWITTLTSEFVVTSNPQAPDLMIGHALRAKAECLRNMYRSYKALSHHYRYEAGLVHTPNHSLSSHALRSLHPKEESEGPDSPGTGYPLVTVSPRSRKPRQQRYGVQGRYHRNNRDGLDEDSPPTPQPLSVKSEPIKSSYSDNSPKVASMNRPTTTDRQTLFGQTTSTLRLSDALVACDPDHRNRNRNRDRTRVSLDQIKYWV